MDNPFTPERPVPPITSKRIQPRVLQARRGEFRQPSPMTSLQREREESDPGRHSSVCRRRQACAMCLAAHSIQVQRTSAEALEDAMRRQEPSQTGGKARQREIAIGALLCLSNIRDAAEAAGISERTLSAGCLTLVSKPSTKLGKNLLSIKRRIAWRLEPFAQWRRSSGSWMTAMGASRSPGERLSVCDRVWFADARGKVRIQARQADERRI